MRIGIIGLGRQGWRLAKAIKEAGDVLVVGATEKKCKNSQIFADNFKCEIINNWQELVKRDDIEAIVICTPPSLHAKMSIAALKNNKNVFCEKPLALSSDEAQEIIKEAQKRNLKLKCGFNLRHHPAVVKAKERVDKGLIGKPFLIRCCYGIGGRKGYEKDWRAKKEISGGGQLMDQGVHIIDLSRWFLGEFNQVFGTLSTNFWKISPLEDNAFFILGTDKNQTSFCHASWTQWKNLFSFEIYGELGYIKIEGLGGSYGTEKFIFGKRDFDSPFSEEIIEFRGEDQSWLCEWQEFTSAIKEDRQPLGNGYDGLKSLDIVEAIYKSAKTKKMIKLN